MKDFVFILTFLVVFINSSFANVKYDFKNAIALIKEEFQAEILKLKNDFDKKLVVQEKEIYNLRKELNEQKNINTIQDDIITNLSKVSQYIDIHLSLSATKYISNKM